jgi:hypothetical protein
LSGEDIDLEGFCGREGHAGSEGEEGEDRFHECGLVVQATGAGRSIGIVVRESL